MNEKIILDRKKYLLQLIINEYIKTGKPVSSKILCDKYKLEQSSATVRNNIAILEKDGFLIQPHISSGRIPTTKGYKYYVNFLIKIQKITLKEKSKIQNEFDNKINELDKILYKTSKMLAIASKFIGFSVISNIEKSKISYIQLTKIDINHVLFLIITEDNIIKHKIIFTQYEIDEKNILDLTIYFNNKFKGKTLSDITEEAIRQIIDENYKNNNIINLLNNIINNLSNIFENKICYLEENPNFINNFDFNEEIYQNFRDQNILQQVLEKKLLQNNKITKNNINIHIVENDVNDILKNCSIISHIYKINNKPVGIFGIIGPKRMNYKKMLGLIEYISNILEKWQK